MWMFYFWGGVLGTVIICFAIFGIYVFFTLGLHRR
jgi:hypothetical protein